LANDPFYRIALPVLGKERRRHDQPETLLDVRELGGALAQNWPSYLAADPSSSLIFLVDADEPTKLSEAAVLLVQCLEVLARKARSSNVPAGLLLVFSKCDLVPLAMQPARFNQIEQVLQIARMTQWYAGSISIDRVACSSSQNEGVAAVKNWLLTR